jgi:hypothetical protein
MTNVVQSHTTLKVSKLFHVFVSLTMSIRSIGARIRLCKNMYAREHWERYIHEFEMHRQHDVCRELH